MKLAQPATPKSTGTNKTTMCREILATIPDSNPGPRLPYRQERRWYQNERNRSIEGSTIRWLCFKPPENCGRILPRRPILVSFPQPFGGDSNMKPERPVVVLVFAILNIVFGGFGTLGMCCAGVMTVFFGAMFSSVPSSAHLPP